MEHNGNGVPELKSNATKADKTSDLLVEEASDNGLIVKSLNEDCQPLAQDVKNHQNNNLDSVHSQDIDGSSGPKENNNIQTTSQEPLSDNSVIKDNLNANEQAVEQKQLNVVAEDPKEEDKDGAPVAGSLDASSSAQQNQASPNVGTVRREKCRYGKICYRKDPQHKKKYSHPGDSDYDLPDDREECPYGRKCYRKNALHKAHFKHTRIYPRRKCTQNQTKGSPSKMPRYDISWLDDSSDEALEESVDESDYEPKNDDDYWDDDD